MFRNAGDEDKLYLFGGGARSCVGKHLVDTILKVSALCAELLNQWNYKNVGILYNISTMKKSSGLSHYKDQSLQVWVSHYKD